MTEEHDLSNEISNNIVRIARELVNGRIGFLFGSGMSIPSGGIDGQQLAYQLIKKGYFPARDDSTDSEFQEQLKRASSAYPLEAIAAGVAQKQTFQKTGLREILEEVTFPNKKPSKHKGHEKLATIIERLHTVRMLFTTNWDLLLEDSIGVNAIKITPDDQKQYMFNIDDLKTKGVLVIHLHGTFKDKPYICEKDLMDFDKPLFQLFLSEMMTKSFIFIGYSLSDPNIRALYYKAANILSKINEELKKTTYVVFPPKDEVDKIVSKNTWQARNAVYIPLDAENFFIRLQSAIETHALSEMKEKLCKRLGLTSMDLIDQRINEIMRVFPDFHSTDRALLYLYSITKGK